MLFLYHGSEEANATESDSNRQNYFLNRVKDAVYYGARKLAAFLPFRKKSCQVVPRVYRIINTKRGEKYATLSLQPAEEEEKDDLEVKVNAVKLSEINGSDSVLVVKCNGDCGVDNSEGLILLNKFGRRIN